MEVPVYGVGKTVADLFEFRNKVGTDVAIEALRETLRERRRARDEIRRYAHERGRRGEGRLIRSGPSPGAGEGT